MGFYNINEKEEVCANCKHFVQHYVSTRHDGFTPCNGGHCIYPRVKDRKPGTPACEHFAFGNWKDKYQQIDTGKYKEVIQDAKSETAGFHPAQSIFPVAD